MKKYYFLLIILILPLLGAGCNNNQQETIGEQQKKIDELGKKVEEMSNQQASQNQTIKDVTQKQANVLEKQVAIEKKFSQVGEESKEIVIQSAELGPYLTGVVNVICGDLFGSGSLSKFWGEYFVLTNRHVIDDITKSCEIDIWNQDNRGGGAYLSDPSKLLSWNSLTDVALIKIGAKKPNINGGVDYSEKYKNISELNYKISDLPHCPTTMPVGAPVAVIGFPAFGVINSTLDGYPVQMSTRIVSNGIVSGYDSVIRDTFKLPYSNYFVSAKIDSGNSGGIAFSKNENGLCVLGIPTWLNVGNYETQGVAQNIHNVIYKGE